MTTTKKKRKTTKRRYRKVDAGVASMEKTMEATTKMVGTVAIAGMGIGLVGGVLGSLGK